MPPRFRGRSRGTTDCLKASCVAKLPASNSALRCGVRPHPPLSNVPPLVPPSTSHIWDRACNIEAHRRKNSGRPDRAGGMYPLRVGVTMSLHKLTAGAGYDYLTRQVAALDATQKGHTGLASYYTERGETPGVWVGSGLDGLDGLSAGDPVTAEQMRALFGCGLHPLAELRQQQLEGPDLTDQDFQNVARLGAPFKIVDNDLRP